jgi:hypothetical protein
MESALGIAAVSAVLRHLLENGLAAQEVTEGTGGEVLVSAQPPDRINTGDNERTQVNLFLYLVTPNTAMPRLRTDGDRPLSLDLHYVVSVYSANDLVCDLLLGAVTRVFQRAALLDAAGVATTLAAATTPSRGRNVPPPLAAIGRRRSSVDLGALQIVPHFPNLEDAARLWSATQARYRPSLYYRVSMAQIAP